MAKTVKKVNNTSSNSSAVGNVSNISVGITEVDMNRFADLSYLDIPDELMDDYLQGTLTLYELCDYYLKNVGDIYPNDTKRNDYIVETLNKFKGEPYCDFKIVKYVNNNKGSGSKATGLVAYTIEVAPGEVITTFRGSELKIPKGINGENFAKIMNTIMLNPAASQQMMTDEEIRKAFVEFGIGLDILSDEFIDICRDWIDNFLLIGDITAQQQDAIDYMNDLFENGYKVYGVDEPRKPIKVVTTGHSKGGNNAQIVTICVDEEHSDKIVACYSFNAPGHSLKILEKYKTEISKYSHKIKNYKYKHDIVSRLLTSIGEIIHVKSKNNKWWKIGEQHLLHSAKIDEDGNSFVRGNQNLIDTTIDVLSSGGTGIGPSYIYYKQIEEMNKVKADKDAESIKKFDSQDNISKTIGLVSNNIVSNVNSVVNELDTTSKSSYKSSSKIMVNIDEIEQYIYIYDKEIDNMQNALSSIEKSMNLLMRDAWSGKSKNNFYQRKYIACKIQIEKCINQMEETKDFLKQCKYSFEDLKAQEDRVVRSFSI